LASEPNETLLDWLVGKVASAMDSFGWNGTRLRWRWSQRKRDLGEAGLRATFLLRSTKGQFKMCASCRALVPRSAWKCPSCGASMAAVRAPGVGRLLANVLPGATAVTGVLLLVNGLLFLLVLVAPVGGDEAPAAGVSRLMSFDLYSLLRYGGGFGPLVVAYGEWWRLVVPIFLHGGLLHFAFNSMALLQLGPMVEEEFGTERFAVLYLVCGIFGNVASQILRLFFSSPVFTVGASGAIFGLIGILLVHGVRRGGAFGGALRGMMLQYVLFGIVISFVGRVDWLCHAGGFAAGLLLGAVVPSGPFRGRATAVAWEGMALVAVAVTLWALYCMATQGENGALLLQRGGL
jgi:rhomboid protease GluP